MQRVVPTVFDDSSVLMSHSAILTMQRISLSLDMFMQQCRR